MKIQEFYDQPTGTLTYVVYSLDTQEALLIDPVWNYDVASSTLRADGAQKVMGFLETTGLRLLAILETHAHADHLTAAQVIKKSWPHVPIGVGQGICKVQKYFAEAFNFEPNFKTDGSQFDFLLADGEERVFGAFRLKAFSTPGHTPGCMSYLINDQCLFTGDSIFMPDFGTGRCDFPNGSAEQLYDSIQQKIYSLPDEVLIYVGHDYQPGGRELRFFCTVAEQKKTNIHVKAETTKEEFVRFRTARDKTLAAPQLLLPSIQVNIRAGHLPPAEANGVSYLKLPIKVVES